ncbi:MAG: F0F1 ATP synthase subunit B [Gemmatirosa sp.]
MRTLLRSLSRPLSLAVLSAVAVRPAFAQEAEHGAAAGGGGGLLDPHAGLMVWTLLIFLVLMAILSKFAFKPLTAAVEARERSLEEAIAGAKRDREEAARLLAEQRAQLEGSRGEAQKLIADARAAGEKMRADMLEQTRQQQAELLDRARRDIDAERDRAIADLRREAVDLALAGASKVIERNLDDAGNRQLVEQFLATIPTNGARR